ncbi:MAG: metal-dependent hydrolase, partial [Sporomusa sp.]|nr:metal-dependent hydrolase [Sporomusa sp.]
MKRFLFYVVFSILLLSGSMTVEGANGNSSDEKVTLTYYGQSAFMLSHGNTKLILDPYLSKSP